MREEFDDYQREEQQRSLLEAEPGSRGRPSSGRGRPRVRSAYGAPTCCACLGSSGWDFRCVGSFRSFWLCFRAI